MASSNRMGTGAKNRLTDSTIIQPAASTSTIALV